ncbi:MAG: hypothetical protein J7L15_08995, partial [Clostridiales bacterium]|nr:hypothetical protein [Clostridiales bacterium]
MEKKYCRKCPLCRKKLGYTNKKNRNFAEKKGILCVSCSQKEAHKRPEVILKHKKRALLLSEKYIGKGNPFYGRKHSEATKDKIRKVDKSYTQTKKFRKKSARHGIRNGMYGKTFYDVWLEKYGKIEADKKMEQLKKKRSLNASGKNNSMYGKPSPQGSGNGWSGWYKGWFFRSLKELSYVIKEIESKNKKWRTAETKDLIIKYIDYKNDERTYRADFLVEEKYLIEVKPSNFESALTTRLNPHAALKFCQKKS